MPFRFQFLFNVDLVEFAKKVTRLVTGIAALFDMSQNAFGFFFFFFCKTTLILRAKRTVNYRTPEFRTVFIDKNDRTESGFAQTVQTRMHNNNILNTTGHLHARFFLYGHPQFGIITSII